MTAKEILSQLRATFNELVPSSAIKLIYATLADGTAVLITDLAVGGVVTINGAPAPAGEHTLSDGTVLEVGDNGAILEIKAPEAAPAAAPPAAMESQFAEKFAAFETATSEKFAAYEAKFSDYEAKLAKATTLIDGLLTLTQKLAEMPTGTPDQAVQSSAAFSETKKDKDYSILFS
jgi:hypothetical protein